MEKKKKYRISGTELSLLLVDKELEPYGVTAQQMIDLPDGKANGENWYQYYTFNTPEEFNIWKEFCLDILSNNVTPKLPKKLVESNFAMLDLMWGLKRNYDESSS